MAITVHVVPVGDEWLVIEDGQHLTTYRAPGRAETFARQEAIRAGGELVVHGFDGRVEWKRRFVKGVTD